MITETELERQIQIPAHFGTHDLGSSQYTYPAVLNCISFNVVDCASSDCFYRSSLYWAARQQMTGRSETGYKIKE
ncbi:hypothetical protein TNCV_1449361 [Trichonephila clavipes]|nr:hypothetical protein TNCV_1449361 [Trichonephila clavipes]